MSFPLVKFTLRHKVLFKKKKIKKANKEYFLYSFLRLFRCIVHWLCLNHSPFLFAISGIWKLYHHTVKPDVDDEKSRICCILLQNNYIFIPTRPHPHPVEILKGDIADMSYWHCVSEVCNVHPRHFRETRQCRGANFFKQFIFYLPWRIFWAHRFWTADN